MQGPDTERNPDTPDEGPAENTDNVRAEPLDEGPVSEHSSNEDAENGRAGLRNEDAGGEASNQNNTTNDIAEAVGEEIAHERSRDNNGERVVAEAINEETTSEHGKDDNAENAGAEAINEESIGGDCSEDDAEVSSAEEVSEHFSGDGTDIAGAEANHKEADSEHGNDGDVEAAISEANEGINNDEDGDDHTESAVTTGECPSDSQHDATMITVAIPGRKIDDWLVSRVLYQQYHTAPVINGKADTHCECAICLRQQPLHLVFKNDCNHISAKAASRVYSLNVRRMRASSLHAAADEKYRWKLHFTIAMPVFSTFSKRRVSNMRPKIEPTAPNRVARFHQPQHYPPRPCCLSRVRRNNLCDLQSSCS